MAKRSIDDITSGEQAYLKRQKISISTTQLHSAATVNIISGKQLERLLSFNQDCRSSSHSIQSFKAFLDNLLASEDNATQLFILKDYLELQRLSCGEGKLSIFLPDLFQTWRFASQSNNEILLSAVPAVLALLFRVISNSCELSLYGTKLGKTLLLKSHLELIKRGLTASIKKEYVISPVLRLLRELSMIEKGVLANHIYRSRNFTFQAIIRNLHIRFTGKGTEDLRKPSVRTNAVRFVLQLLKYISIESKKDFLCQRDIVAALASCISDDPPFLVHDLLDTLKTHIIKDDDLPRDAKTKLLTSKFLGIIASLYSYVECDDNNKSTSSSIPDSAHEFLLLACTSLNLGVLLNQTGLYPKGSISETTKESFESNKNYIDLGIDSIEWMHMYAEKFPVRNVILSEFIQNLRPWFSLKQMELIRSIFKVAPELVSEYFLNKKTYVPDPKLTATWVGYSSLVFSTIKLPLPNYFGHKENYAHLPPPLYILLEHVLPRKFSQKLLTKCFNQTASSFLTFSAVRILCVAFLKLQEVLKMCREASRGSLTSIWTQYASRITEIFTDRCPAIHYVISGYRRLDYTDLCQREALAKLISLYYEIIPRVALETNSGASSIIAQTLVNIDEMNIESQDSVFRALGLENVLRIASFSPGEKWYKKTNNLTISPFLGMLKLCVLAPENIPLSRLKTVLLSVVEENQILQTYTNASALDYFVMSLRSVLTEHNMSDLYDFIESCVSRCAATPLKYIFKLEELISESAIPKSTKPTLSLVSLVMLEQWPFYVSSADVSSLRKIANFISQHLASSVKIKEDKFLIQNLSEKFAAGCFKYPEMQKIIINYAEVASRITTQEIKPHSLYSLESRISPLSIVNEQIKTTTETFDWEILPEDNNSLTKWRNKDIEDIIEDGYMGSLMMLLSSKHLSIRKEALINIFKLSQKLKDSSFEEKGQIWLLLSELSETAKSTIDQAPLPTFISAFCYHAIGVLKNPSHFLFPKINRFLSKQPIWQLDSIPLMHFIMEEAPSLDGSVLNEREWMLSLMYHGLRSKTDFEIFRRKLVFERLLSYNFQLNKGLHEKVLKIFTRACMIEEGSTTLVTRFSLTTWLEIHQEITPSINLDKLYRCLIVSCDKKRVNIWSRGVIKNTCTEL